MKVAFTANPVKISKDAEARLKKRYGSHTPSRADVIVALGGDGFMLKTLHSFMEKQIPIYGMNLGRAGFLMNAYSEDRLLERLQNAKQTTLHPLKLSAVGTSGKKTEALAVNEVSLLRQSPQTAHLRIFVDGKVRIETLMSDGVLLSTAAGSTAYNLSVGGPIIPIGAPLLALTPISAFRPRSWRGALLPSAAHVEIRALEAKKRPISAVADHFETRNVEKVGIREEKSISLHLLFDDTHSLEERIISEQFRP